MSSATGRSTKRGPAKVAGAALVALTVVATGGLPAVVSPLAAEGASPVDDSQVISLLAGKWGDDAADGEALAGGKRNKPENDAGSLYTLSKAIGARKLWRHSDPIGRPLTGAGVTVALLDSGVSNVPGLDQPGKVVHGPDFSGGSEEVEQDAFGHGTFMAGLIAAKDQETSKSGKVVDADSASPNIQQGLAPDAQLLSLKLAGADGSTSVDAVIDALAWTVAHKDDEGLNVRVVNLSFGAQALQPYQVDPLAAAAEAAWHAGIVVVASVGNDGAGTAVSDPAMDPYVIAVGASDPRSKVAGWDHPVLAGFSQQPVTGRRADLVAPGASIVGLRVPGSTIDVANPQGRIAGDASRRLFRGSGTSQAAAVVSASAALLLQARPALTPDQVKAALVGTASKMSEQAADAGAGQVDLGAALKAVEGMDKNDKLGLSRAVQTHPRSAGLEGAELGEHDGDWTGSRWNGSRWNGSRWNGSRWNGSRWNGSRWNGSRWNGVDWS